MAYHIVYSSSLEKTERYISSHTSRQEAEMAFKSKVNALVANILLTDLEEITITSNSFSHTTVDTVHSYWIE